MVHQQLEAQDLDSLRNRAHAYCREVNRPVPSPELAQILFRRSMPNDSVSPLLIRTLLRRDDRFLELSHGTWDLVEATYHAQPLRSARFVVVDLEATGSDCRTDRIIEVGMVVIEDLQIHQRYSSLVNPMTDIPPIIRRLTGIHEAELEDAPRLHQVAPQIVKAMKGAVFVAHNVDFDYPFLRSQLRDAGFDPPPWPRLCTVRLARRFMAGLDSYRLNAVAEHCGVELRHHHRAVEDATASAGILLHIIQERVIPTGAVTLGDMLNALRRR